MGVSEEKKASFNVLVVFFPHSPSLDVERERDEGKDLMVSNKGDLHKPGSGSRAAVENEKVAASRHPYRAQQGPA